MPEYETFYGRELREGEPFDLELIDRDTREIFVARVRTSRDPDELPGSTRLTVRDHLQGNVAPRETWFVTVLKRLDADEVPAPIQKAEIPLEERQGFLLRSLLEERLKGEERN